MELVPIGEAAHRLGMNTSALRYYEERGLVRPAERRNGRRMYGPDELRQLAFVQVMQRLGMGLDVAAAVLEQPSDQWRSLLREQMAAFELLIARATAARGFLQHAIDCPAHHPVRQCPHLIETLDRQLRHTTADSATSTP
ncbi:MerR family transcriptional regulator [Plantactinospora siamensis]|uniref:MerR family transcriptional regulator n=1 Tax=Plantactinospora siamensis TaxID=555372 RepID=A0ABV6P3C6_9ACTN